MTADVVLLDLDGTVLDTHDLILASWAHVKQAFGIEADDEAFRLGIGRPLEQVLGPFVPPGLDVATLAAAYAFGLAKAHPFNDGNKRTAFLTAVIFLGLNGKDLDATETEVVQVMTALAAGTLTEAAMATWIRERLVRLKL